MTLEVLVSTMNNDLSLIQKMNLQQDCVVVNQIDEDQGFYKEFDNKEHTIKWMSVPERGLSKSRNQCLKHATADIVLIADDDLIYKDGIFDQIIAKFEENPDYDILIFEVNDSDKTFKEYAPYEHGIGYFRSLRVSSVQIAFRLESIKEHSLKFNEFFGSGSYYLMGEENIFLFDALRSKLKIKFIPLQIATLKLGNSSWFRGFNKKYLFDRGASFEAMSPKISLFLITQFALRKKKLFDKLTLKDMFKYQLQGRKDYRLKKKN